MKDKKKDYLTFARNYADIHHGNESVQHKCAFANCVSYAMTGWSGGYGGPSFREHVFGYMFANVTKQADLETIIELAREICFGTICLDFIHLYDQNICFDDDEDDIAIIRIALAKPN